MNYFKGCSVIFVFAVFALFCPTEQVLLDDQGKFDLDWVLNEDKSSVTFTVKVTNDPEGFVALGVSPTSMMTNSDIAVYEIKNGKKTLQDYHVKQAKMPILDKQQDVVPIKFDRAGSVTTIVFSRKLVTGDPNKGEDIDITEGETTLIWAYGDSPTMEYHQTRRGSKTVNIFKPSAGSSINMDVTQEVRRDAPTTTPTPTSGIPRPTISSKSTGAIIQSGITITMFMFRIFLASFCDGLFTL